MFVLERKTKMTEIKTYHTNMSKLSPSRALEALSTNLKALALQKDWRTQDALGKNIGLAQKAVARILNKEHEPQLDTLCHIADKLNISEAALLLPGLGAVQYLSDKTISEPLRALIEQLIRLDKAGELTGEALKFLQMGIDMATHTDQQQHGSAKRSAQ